MIYPFTCMVIYSIIWYQGEENSVAENRDQYSCEFSKMIEYWRNTSFQRTNGSADIQFPFGFVQVRIQYINSKNYLNYNHSYSYHHLWTKKEGLMDFHGFDGIKHLILAIYQIMSFRKYLRMSL